MRSPGGRRKQLLTLWVLRPPPARVPLKYHRKFQACEGFAGENAPPALPQWDGSRTFLRVSHWTKHKSANPISKTANGTQNCTSINMGIHQSRCLRDSSSLITHSIYGTAKQLSRHAEGTFGNYSGGSLASSESALLNANVTYQEAYINYQRATWTLLDGMGMIVEAPKVR